VYKNRLGNSRARTQNAAAPSQPAGGGVGPRGRNFMCTRGESNELIFANLHAPLLSLLIKIPWPSVSHPLSRGERSLDRHAVLFAAHNAVSYCVCVGQKH